MARVTVYIPDELLGRARGQDLSVNTSQLVQRGLERLLAGSSTPYASRPPDAAALVSRAKARLEPAAASEFQRGYRAALDMVNEAFYRELDEFARQGLSLLRWAESWRKGAGADAAGLTPGAEHGFYPGEWFVRVAKDLGALVDPIGYDEFSFMPTHAFVAGYETGLRDVWAALEEASTIQTADDVGTDSEEQGS